MATSTSAQAMTGVRSHGLSAGVQAPPLDLPSTQNGRTVSLADFRGSSVVLVFYPNDFSPVCTSELGVFNEILPELSKLGGQVLGVSCDSVWSHNAFAAQLHLHFPLLSDFHPKAAASRRYQVYREEEGCSERALFVIDAEGEIFWSYVSPIEIDPGADGVLDALERLSGRKLGQSVNQQSQQTEAPQ